MDQELSRKFQKKADSDKTGDVITFAETEAIKKIRQKLIWDSVV